MNNSVRGLLKTLQQTPVQSSPKVGQMLSGKVLKLLPQNRAIVHLGSQQVNAQLEAPLTSGQKYLFQVQSTEKMVHLKVVSEKSLSQGQRDGARLMDQLGLKMTKMNIDLLQRLVSSNIPFQRMDLKKAMDLLNQSSNKSTARDVLFQMFQKQLPIKASVFDALHTRETIQISKTLEQIQQGIKTELYSRSMTEQKVTSLISNLKGTASSLSLADTSVTKLLTEVTSNNTSSFQLFKKAGIISENISFPQFQREWSDWAGRTQQTNPTPIKQQELLSLLRNQKVESAPFPASLEQISKKLKQLFEQQLPMTFKEQQTLKQWVGQLERVVSNVLISREVVDSRANLPKSLIDKLLVNHQTLQQGKTFQKVMPFLNQQQQSTLDQTVRELPQVLIRSDHSQTFHLPGVKELIANLESLQSKQLPQSLSQSLTEWVSRLIVETPSGSNKEMMLIKMKAMLQLSGMLDEPTIKSQLAQEQPMQKEMSLKSALLQSLQESGGGVKPDTAKQMIHLLNGLQMTAQQETPQSLQMTLQFPGEWLGIASDIHMNMEGRKTEDGEIDPDFCHIVFYLDLKYMEKTVIDLNISNRRVGVTVFNDDQSIESVLNKHREPFTAGLQALGYELRSLNVKGLKPLDNSHKTPAQRYSGNLDEGVDLRI